MTTSKYWAGLVVAILALAAVGPAAAGPWTKNMGRFYAKVGQGFYFSDSFRDSSGNLQQGVDYLSFTTSLFFQVGVYKGLHVSGYLPYIVASNYQVDEGARWTRASGGDARFALQYTPTFIGLPFPAAIRLEFKVPFYDAGGVGGPYAARFPAPGDGQVDVTFWLTAGGSLRSIPLFFSADIGYELRTEAFIGTGPFAAQFNDGIAFLAQVGYTFFGRLLVAVNTRGVIPFEAGQVTKGYVSVGPSLYGLIWRGLAAEASVTPMIYTNENAAPGVGFSLGLSFKN